MSKLRTLAKKPAKRRSPMTRSPRAKKSTRTRQILTAKNGGAATPSGLGSTSTTHANQRIRAQSDRLTGSSLRRPRPGLCGEVRGGHQDHTGARLICRQLRRALNSAEKVVKH